MRSSRYLFGAAVSIAAMVGMTSCNGQSSNKGADSDTAVVEAAPVEASAPADSIAAIFSDPAKATENATDSTYATTTSGLKYMVVKEGTGKTPGAEDLVTVHYTGKLTDGTVFDSSATRGEPATFPLNRVIPGWTEGLQLMKEGGVTIFYIPSQLAYGEQGAAPIIGPNEDLIFEVELFKVGE